MYFQTCYFGSIKTGNYNTEHPAGIQLQLGPPLPIGLVMLKYMSTYHLTITNGNMGQHLNHDNMFYTQMVCISGIVFATNDENTKAL